MRNLWNSLTPLLVWGLFFATSVIGHVALKRGAGGSNHYDFRAASSLFLSPWGLTALSSWAVSCWLWAVLLTRHSLIAANSVSTLRYLLICAAAAALLNEPLGPRELAGAAFIAAGTWLIAR